jgi:ubiquinone/menaquinone biosynthesis C-methylase UbiE
MSDHNSTPLHRAARLRDAMAYGVSQTLRVGWYFGHYAAAARLTPRVDLPGAIEPGRLPDLRTILSDLRGLFARDWRNVRDGVYKVPWDAVTPRPADAVRRSLRFFADLPSVHLRRRAGGHQEVAMNGDAAACPRYFRQNFHYQTDGYLSENSADLYDTQVETLFLGGADAMRRQALPPLKRHLAGQPRARILDLACGNGHFMTFLADNFPDASLIGLDLSLPYLKRAAKALRSWPGPGLLQANAEILPLADSSIDAISSIFLFHELPRQARAKLVAEAARALKPGGVFVFLDSLQTGDRPHYDALLERFPVSFHEPYYAEYCASDLERLFVDAGFDLVETSCEFLAKRLVLVRR